MIVKETGIDGLLLIEQKKFVDERGLFTEAYNKLIFTEAGIEADFVQDNVSVSAKDVLRGLHFQQPPFAQGKLVRVLKGSVLDVVVDIRKNSTTFGNVYKEILSAQQNNLLWIPEGFAHGFLSLEEDTIFSYKCTNYYNKTSEDAILWNDPDLNIDWGIKEPLMSEKDRSAQSFSKFKSLF
jgi:dTDP-4-dehydrorhamnose 3,5-epimerase